jgi:hypothetical protein
MSSCSSGERLRAASTACSRSFVIAESPFNLYIPRPRLARKGGPKTMQQHSGDAVIPSMDDEALVETVAGDYVRLFGLHATARLRERQEIAAAQGDVLSADTWGEIAEAAHRIILQSN